MKTAISIPDRVFRSAEQLAARLGISRSELFTRAVSSMLDQHRDELVTERLNQVYGGSSPAASVDADILSIQYRSTAAREKW